MNGYTKLFGSIIASTIWREKTETKVVWITMLAMANKHGIVEASVPGLADLSRVSLADTQTALEIFSAPDTFSRTKDFDGRRIEAVDGGWVILNHAKYRAKMSLDERREYNRLKQQEFRERQKRASSTNCQTRSITVNHGDSQSAMSAQADTKAQASQSTDPSAAPTKDVAAEAIYDLYPRKQGRKDALKAIRAAMKLKPAAELETSVRSYAAAVRAWPEQDRQFVPHPATWFNRGSYDDDPATWQRNGVNGTDRSPAPARIGQNLQPDLL